MEPQRKEIPVIPWDENFDDDLKDYKPGPITILITLLLVLAMLVMLIWPLLQNGHRRSPTPTPGILQEA